MPDTKNQYSTIQNQSKVATVLEDDGIIDAPELEEKRLSDSICASTCTIFLLAFSLTNLIWVIILILLLLYWQQHALPTESVPKPDTINLYSLRNSLLVSNLYNTTSPTGFPTSSRTQLFSRSPSLSPSLLFASASLLPSSSKDFRERRKRTAEEEMCDLLHVDLSDDSSILNGRYIWAEGMELFYNHENDVAIKYCEVSDPLGVAWLWTRDVNSPCESDPMAMSPVVDLHVAVMDVVPLIRSRNGEWTPDTDATIECRSADRERQQICERILQSRQKAEELWLSQSHSYVYMQHSRKAGGTSLCMALRLNAFGLIQLHKKDHQSTPRETCQIEEFCSDCDIKRKPWYSIGALPDKLMRVMDAHERNFIEIEGSGVPINMLDDSSWGNFVFVSTLRDPIDRIVSLLYYDQCHKDREKCFTKRKASFVKETKKRCAEKIYDCASNYYVRMFSGLDNKFTNDTHMLLTAKMNFLRFSCVVLLEYWDRTSICLQRLGMYLKDSDVAFNMQGNLDTMSSTNPKADYSHMNMLSEEELRVMRSVNEVDIEFYQWAKQQLLRVASSQRCTGRPEGTYN